MTDSAQSFAKLFAQTWQARDAAGLAALFVPDGDFLSLTGAWVEGGEAIGEILAGEFAGAFQRARLVTGRTKTRALGPGAAVLHQRFVLSGMRNEDGSEAGRIAAVLMAVLVQTAEGWRAVAAQFCPEGD